MQRYLLVLDMDLLAVDEQLGLEPISYLLARQEEQPSDVVCCRWPTTATHGCQRWNFCSAPALTSPNSR